MKPARGTLVEMRGARNYARMIDVLITTGGSTEELAEASGLHVATIYRYIKAFRELKAEDQRQKKCRIIGWAPDQRGYLTRPVYKLEVGRDVFRPAMTEAQKSKAYRDRNAASRGRAVSNVFRLSAL